MNTPTPAIVTQRGAARLPRVALWLLCAAYLVPGLLGRDPWKHADISAFGQMLGIARGWTSALSPSVAGVAVDGGGLFPYWLGAAFIRLLPGLDPALAARLPFAALLGVVLMLTWYSTYRLARTEAAQPLPFAFGGEASAADYARAIADGGLLALIACLGLLQLGHETTPELVQLTGATLYLYALSACLARPRAARVAILSGLILLAGSGAPSLALALTGTGTIVCLLSRNEPASRFIPWLLIAGTLAALTGYLTSTWAWRVTPTPPVLPILRSLTWFPWPAWPLALWTLWRWRGHLDQLHIAAPLSLTLTGVLACIVMNGSDRALLLSLPGLAVLAAFALPTLKRSVSSAIDWFTVFFFTACAIGIWVVYSAVQTGIPSKTASNVAKLAAPGFRSEFSWIALLVAACATLAWVAVVRWRTQSHPTALWKSLVLPASGVALCWLLLMTLWLPLLDHGRSYRSQVVRLKRHIPAHADCVAAPGANAGLLTALEYFAELRVVGGPKASNRCSYMVLNVPSRRPAPAFPGWQDIARERERGASTDALVVYKRLRNAGS